jgi:hypothetical protein
LEEAKRATDTPYIGVIGLDEHDHPIDPVATRPGGRPIPVIVMPAPAAEDVQIMATPEKLRQRSQY